MRDIKWAEGWTAALQDAAAGVANVTEQRRGTTVRDTRSVARRLGASAVTLFAQRGFDAVTVEEIAARAGVTSRTFFRYFPAKETVIVDIYDQTNARLLQLIEAYGGSGTQVLPALTGAVVQWCEEYGDLFTALVRLSESSETLLAATLIRSLAWEEHLAEALSKRFPLVDDIDAKVWAHTTMAMMRLLQQNAVSFGLSYADSARQVFRRFTDLVPL